MTTTTTTAPASDDLALVRRYAAGGSAEAFAAVVARHADFVFATALRQTRDRELAEDVTQATFIVLARRAASLRDGTSVAGFLHQTAVYAAKNALRAKQRRRRHEAGAARDPAAPAASDERAGDHDEAARAVDRALTRLRESDRRLLVLHYFDGLTLAEAAAKLAISHEAARKRLHRALERLRAHLQRNGVTVAVDAVPAVVTAIARCGVEAKAAAIASAAVAGGAGGTAFSLAFEVLRTFQLLALKKAAAAVAVATLVITGATVAISQAARPTSAASRPARQHVLPLPPPPPAAPPAPAPEWPLSVRRDVPTTLTTRAAPPARRQQPPSPEPSGTYIVDYTRVFDSLRRTRDERARLDAARTDMMRQDAARAKRIADLRQQVGAATAPAARSELESQLNRARAEHEEIRREQEAKLDAAAAEMLIEIFRQIEDGIVKAAAAEGVRLPPDAFPPYPAGIDAMRGSAVRQYLMTRRRLRRPEGAADLTDRVIALLNPPQSTPTTAPVTRPVTRPATLPASP